MIVFFSGAPKAGKSVTLAALYKRLQAKGGSGSSFFLERLAPDCEGVWTAESRRQDLARAEKNRLKTKGEFFSPAFVAFKVKAIEQLSKRFHLVLLDMGGIPSDENRKFVQASILTGVPVRAVRYFRVVKVLGGVFHDRN